MVDSSDLIFESQVPPEKAVNEAVGVIRLVSNINNPTTLLSGTPEQVWTERSQA